MIRKLLAVAAVWVLAVGLAHAQGVPKKGTVKGTFSWYAVGKIHEMEQSHLVFTGEFGGVFLSEPAGGVLDRAAVSCPGINDIYLEGSNSYAYGTCVVTDKDGDKIFVTWNNRGSAFVRPNGDARWTGGTGKYAGIKATGKFDTTVLVPTNSGFSVWNMPYELP